MLFLVLAVFLGLIPGFIASSKGHSFVGWWVFGSLLFIVALPVSLFLAPAGSKRKCPFCTETINTAATVCPHCQRDVPAPIKQVQQAAPPLTTEQLRRQRRPFKIAVGVFSALFLSFCVFAYLHRNDPVMADSSCSTADLRAKIAADMGGSHISCADLRRIREEAGE